MLFISCISKDSKLNYIKLDSPVIENTVSPSMSLTQKDITDHNQICPCLGVLTNKSFFCESTLTYSLTYDAEDLRKTVENREGVFKKIS